MHHRLMSMLWFSCILGSNCIFLGFKLIIIYYHTQKQRKRKFKPKTKLNHNIYTTPQSNAYPLGQKIKTDKHASPPPPPPPPPPPLILEELEEEKPFGAFRKERVAQIELLKETNQGRCSVKYGIPFQNWKYFWGLWSP